MDCENMTDGFKTTYEIIRCINTMKQLKACSGPTIKAELLSYRKLFLERLEKTDEIIIRHLSPPRKADLMKIFPMNRRGIET